MQIMLKLYFPSSNNAKNTFEYFERTQATFITNFVYCYIPAISQLKSEVSKACLFDWLLYT